MRIVLSAHARKRMKERNIPEIFIHNTLLQPDVVAVDKTARNRFVAKKICQFPRLKNQNLLLVIYEKNLTEIKVITVISTSKINKYL